MAVNVDTAPSPGSPPPDNLAALSLGGRGDAAPPHLLHSPPMSQTVPADHTHTPLWRNPNFTLMWTSVAASGFGDRLIMLIGMALLGVTKTDTASVSISAAINFWFFLPYLLISPPGGWLADMFPRKWIMVFCDEGRAGLLFYAFILIPAVGAVPLLTDSPEKVYGLIAAVGCLAAVFNPSRNATVPQLVPLRQLPAANGIIISIATIASLIGMLVGGMVIKPEESSSLRTCLLMAISLYVVSGFMLTFLRIAGRKRSEERAAQPRKSMGIFAGLSYMTKHPRTIALTAISMLVWGAAMIVSNVFIALCKDPYGFEGNEIVLRYSQLFASLGAGMLAGGMFVAWMNTRRESVTIGMIGLLISGFCVLALALNRFYFLGVAFAFGTGFFGNIAITCTFSLLMGICPNFIRGRVMGVNSLCTTISIVGVNFIIWWLPPDRANTIMESTLLPTALVLIACACYGLYRNLWFGPMKEWNRNFFWHLDRIFMLVWHRVQWFGRENVPMSGAVILASNHTAGIDPFLVQAGLLRRVRWVMVAKNHYKILTPLWKTIDPIVLEEGKAPIRQLKTMLEALEKEELTGIFPEGGLQRDHRALQPFQSGIGMIAVRSGAQVVPVWITGTPATKRMIWHFLKPSRSRVYFGEAYTPDPKMEYAEVVEDLRKRMIKLAERVEREIVLGIPPKCPKCQYDLRAAVASTPASIVCPECGTQAWSGVAETDVRHKGIMDQRPDDP